MEVKVREIIGSREAFTINDAMKLFHAIGAIHPDDLVLSFDGLTILTPTFLVWSIGKYIQRYTYTGKHKDLGFKKLNFSTDNRILKLKIDECIENTLLGEEYDMIVDRAEKACL